MRLRKAELRGRVKADLALRFTRPGLTSFAGLEVVRRYVQRVLAFYEGRIIADGAPGEVMAHPEVRRYVVGEAPAGGEGV